ncbi:hypothetical protein AB0L25_14250 [Spirillospora sp. NPDC052242]
MCNWFCGDAPDTYLDRLIPFAYATSSGSYRDELLAHVLDALGLDTSTP